jgi:hypothetical protein
MSITNFGFRASERRLFEGISFRINSDRLEWVVLARPANARTDMSKSPPSPSTTRVTCSLSARAPSAFRAPAGRRSKVVTAPRAYPLFQSSPPHRRISRTPNHGDDRQRKQRPERNDPGFTPQPENPRCNSIASRSRRRRRRRCPRSNGGEPEVTPGFLPVAVEVIPTRPRGNVVPVVGYRPRRCGPAAAHEVQPRLVDHQRPHLTPFGRHRPLVHQPIAARPERADGDLPGEEHHPADEGATFHQDGMRR